MRDNNNNERTGREKDREVRTKKNKVIKITSFKRTGRLFSYPEFIQLVTSRTDLQAELDDES